MGMTRALFTAALIAVAALSGCASSQAPVAQPPGYDSIVAAANKEGKLVVYSTTSSVPALLQDFAKLHPGIKLEYVDLDTLPMHRRVIEESAAGTTGDVVWSSAMDLQVQLVNDGYAMAYASPEAKNLPPWAVWRNEAFGTTAEPVGIVYNKNLVDAAEVPATRAELIALLKAKPEKFKGKLTAFDPEKSGLGYLLMTQDFSVSAERFREVAQGLQRAGVYPGSGSGAQFARLGKGESLIGYNLLASYATGRAKKDLPQLGVVLPKDHTLLLTRVMFIARKAANPNAARLWVDYVLSKRGQEMLVRSDLGSLRSDVEGDMTLGALGKQLGSALKPIPVGPQLLTYLDSGKRSEFLGEWKRLGEARP